MVVPYTTGQLVEFGVFDPVVVRLVPSTTVKCIVVSPEPLHSGRQRFGAARSFSDVASYFLYKQWGSRRRIF